MADAGRQTNGISVHERLEPLIVDFVERCRRGERPTVTQYAAAPASPARAVWQP